MRKFLLIPFLIFSQYLLAQCFVNEGAGGESSYKTFTSSGNTWIDQTFYQNNQYLINTLGVQVQVGYYDDSETGPNAFAMTHENYYIDGQTYFGINLLNQYFTSDSYNAGFYVLWILSHEYAHILQFKNNGPYWETTKWNELQADFIAGSIAAKHIQENNVNILDLNWRNQYTQQYANVAIQFFENLGDTNFGSKHHHGTASERASAFVAGVNFGLSYGTQIINYGTYITSSLNVHAVWNASVDYINKL
ncbi:MAG: hypothetical protein MK211_13385 [Flavobacteriales bacterium]|jgi:predicted metalloprotease|uniref:hypothetical protein n=1 Tax=Candidatus Ulvibacter alkanivorans TaxID=2267620 RepID=UPI000DF322D5|nr:hypothetical protein [Candidatus Ulvibacter alkanivorans]MCH2491130.1 hypothetical protein [Flavobacteriales bacterium]